MHVKLVYEDYENGVNANETFSDFIPILNLEQRFFEGIQLFINKMQMQQESEDVDNIVH